jgi:PAS domain S-box-containing protein
MIFKFDNKPELEKIINSLDLSIEKGYIAINEISDKAHPHLNDTDQPDDEIRFFSDNYNRIIEILNLISEPLYIKDQNLKWVFVNQAFCDFFGVLQKDILGKTSQNLFEKKQSDLFEHEDRLVLETGSESLIEEEISDNSGQKRYIVTKKKRFIDCRDNPFVIGSFYEITDHRRVENSIKQENTLLENQYKTIFAHANDAILVLNPENAQIITANEKAAEIYGFAIEELSGMNLKQISKNFSYDQIQIENLKKNNVLKNFETIHVSKNLQEISMLVNGSVIEFDGKNAIMNIYNDITDLKQSEKARDAIYQISQLIHSATKLEDLYEPIHNIVNDLMNASNFYIALYDEEQDLLTFPYYIDEKKEKPGKGKLKKGLTEYVLRHGKPLLATPELIEELEKSNEIDKTETKISDWMGVPLITSKKVIGVIVVQSYSSGTQYTIREKDLLVFISEQIAILINKKHADEEIIKAKEIAEGSDKLKTSFIANMSHELRTPMTGIIGFASILAQKITDKDNKMMLDYILTSSNRLMSTLNSILELSQLKAGNKPLEIMKADLNNSIDVSLLPYIEETTKKNITIKKTFQEDIVASFNHNFLLQILDKLFSNAVKFTEKGSIEIKTGAMIYQEETYAFIGITDTGIGIEEDNFSLIFEDFRQVSEGMNRTFEGSGLGLALCKKMAEMMGGQILVDSKIDKGSTFTLLLPYAGVTPVQNPVYYSSPQIDKAPKKSSNVKPRVLVVDDNIINGELIAAFLKNSFEVETTTNGAMAVELVKRSEFDAILMDINLGEGINGIEATLEIRNLNITTPIIALTAYSTEQEMQDNIAGYFSGYIMKPVEKNLLISVLEKATGR